jgi:hypothetical protein
VYAACEYEKTAEFEPSIQTYAEVVLRLTACESHQMIRKVQL